MEDCSHLEGWGQDWSDGSRLWGPPWDSLCVCESCLLCSSVGPHNICYHSPKNRELALHSRHSPVRQTCSLTRTLPFFLYLPSSVPSSVPPLFPASPLMPFPFSCSKLILFNHDCPQPISCPLSLAGFLVDCRICR